MCSKGVCIEDLPVTNVGYVNDLVLLQATDVEVQCTANSKRCYEDERTHSDELYRNTSITEVCHMCKTGVNVLMLFLQ